MAVDFRTCRWFAALVALVLAGPMHAADPKPAAPPATAAKTPDMAAYIKMRWPSRADLAPDGTLYFIYDPDGIFQLYKVAPGRSQKDAVKLTTFKDGIGGYRLSHDGKWIGITAAAGGSEQMGLYLLDTSTDKIEPLYTDPKFVHESVVWRRDSKAFAFRANDTNPADFHVYTYDVATKERKKVYDAPGSNSPADFTSDGSRLIVLKATSATYTQLFEVTVASGESREVTPKDEQWGFEPIGYLPGDKTFLVNTDYRGDLSQIHSIDLASGAVKPVLTEFGDREVDGGTLDDDRNTLAVIVNEDGYGTCYLRKTADFSALPVPAMPKGVVGNVTFSGANMLYAVDNANTPGLIHQWNTKTPDAKPVVLTSADTQGIDVSKFLLPKLVKYPSFDKSLIPAFVYLPADYQPSKKIPFIVQYHGGPESQFRPNFNRSFQYFLSRGYGIIAPNPRGSSGYGKKFIEADNYKDRIKSVKDGIWAAKYVIDQGYTEPKRIAAWGGSYGGFMTMAVITEAPELFGAACNVVGIVNFETFLQQTKDYRRKLREVEYGPLSDPEFLKSISPIHKVDRIDAPLMIAHGLNDPRVPVGEAMQVAVALKKRGKPVEELYFPDEGHGFAKEENRLLYYEQMAKFFERYLK